MARPFPTQFWLTCPHLVTQVSRLEAAGGVARWTRPPQPRSRLCARASSGRTPSSASSVRSCRSASRARVERGSLKCLHAHAAFALARPGYELGDRILAEAAPLWPQDELLHPSMIETPVDVELARHHWEDGHRRVERPHADSASALRLAAEVDLIVAELRCRLGQIFTLEELAATYDGAVEWARQLLHDARPEDGPPPDTAVVTDAAFQMFARGASDYRP